MGRLGVLAAQEDLKKALWEKVSLQKRVAEMKSQLEDCQRDAEEAAKGAKAEMQRELKRQAKAMEYRSFFLDGFLFEKNAKRKVARNRFFTKKQFQKITMMGLGCSFVLQFLFGFSSPLLFSFENKKLRTKFRNRNSARKGLDALFLGHFWLAWVTPPRGKRVGGLGALRPLKPPSYTATRQYVPWGGR